MSTPVALDAAIEEAKIMSEAWDRGDTDAKAMFRATRKLLSALSADRRLEEAESVLREIATLGYYAKGAKIARRYFAAKGGER